MNLDVVLHKVGDKYVAELKKTLRQDRNVATEGLLDSIYYTVKDSVLSVYANDYLLAISEGRKPSSKNPSGDMVSRIVKWMKARGMQPMVRRTAQENRSVKGKRLGNRGGRLRKISDSTRRKAAFAVGRGILREGYSGSRVIKRSYDKLRSEIGDDVMDYFENEVDKSLKKLKVINTRTDG